MEQSCLILVFIFIFLMWFVTSKVCAVDSKIADCTFRQFKAKSENGHVVTNGQPIVCYTHKMHKKKHK